jgi:hypothetical protein
MSGEIVNYVGVQCEVDQKTVDAKIAENAENGARNKRLRTDENGGAEADIGFAAIRGFPLAGQGADTSGPLPGTSLDVVGV